VIVSYVDIDNEGGRVQRFKINIVTLIWQL